MNLIICTTPLQVLIAKRIIEKYPKKVFLSIMLVSKKNEKNKNYYNILKNISNKSYFLNIGNPISKLFYLFFLKCLFFYKNFDKVFIAYFDTLFIHDLLSSLKYSNIITFDEGTANIDNSSYYYKYSKPSIKQNLFRRLFNIKLDTRDIIELSVKHYTIYKNSLNIINNIEFLDLFDLQTGDGKNFNNEISIFLGQPIFEWENLSNSEKNKKNIELTKMAINYSQADFYIPHPRENYNIKDINYIKTSFIFEDYLIKEILNNPNTKYVIYTFFSSAALNVVSLKNVKVVSLYSKKIPNKWINMYNIINKLKINIKNID